MKNEMDGYIEQLQANHKVEVDRLRAEIEQLREAVKNNMKEIGRLVCEDNAEIERLRAYQNETAKAWTKLTESQESEIERLRGLLADPADEEDARPRGPRMDVTSIG